MSQILLKKNPWGGHWVKARSTEQYGGKDEGQKYTAVLKRKKKEKNKPENSKPHTPPSFL